MKTVIDMTGNRHDFPDDWSRERIEKAMASRPAATPTTPANAADLNPDQLSPGPKWIGPIPIPNKGQTREMALNSIPAITGTIGSLPGVLTVDPPLAIYGAGLGGSIGRAGELGLREAMGGPAASMAYLPKKAFGLNLSPAGQVAASIGNAGAIQAANQVVGEGVAALGEPVAKAFYAGGVGQPSSLTEKFPGVDFPEVARREGVVVGSKVGGEGSRQMANVVRSAVNEKRAFQGLQIAQGHTIPADHPAIQRAFDDLVNSIQRGKPNYEGKVAALQEMHDEFLRTHGIVPQGPPAASPILDEYGAQVMRPGAPASRTDMTIPATEQLKQGTSKTAQSIIEGRVTGRKVSPEIMAGLEKAYEDAIHSGTKTALEQVGAVGREPMTNAQGWTLEELNDKIREGIGTRKAVRMAELRRQPLLNPVTTGAIGAAGATTLLGHPALAAAEIGAGVVGSKLFGNPRILTTLGKAAGSSELRNALRLGLPATLRDIELSPFSMDSTVTR